MVCKIVLLDAICSIIPRPVIIINIKESKKRRDKENVTSPA
jgi:hypothetical protein